MEIYKWVPLDRKRHLRGPLSTAASGTTTPVHGGKEARLTSGSLTVDSSNVTSKAPSTGYDRTANDRQIAKMLNRLVLQLTFVVQYLNIQFYSIL